VSTEQRILVEIESLLRRTGIAAATIEASQILQSAAKHSAAEDLAARALRMAAERAAGKPLAYVTGSTTFMGLDVAVAPAALIPREETELLGRTALDVVAAVTGSEPVRVIDMCCGSGNLACAIARSSSRARVWAADLADGAVALAAANATRLGVDDRMSVYQGDLFGALAHLGLQGTIDVIVCNPPYISTGKLAKERAELLQHEPSEAFDGGPYGVSIFQRVVREALIWLKPGGHLLFEIGEGQERQVSLLFARAGGYTPPQSVANQMGQPRVLVGRKQSQE
jgi:release factor glutamine methyltransferase